MSLALAASLFSALLGGCQVSTANGALGQAVFSSSNCGGAFSNVDGCDITHAIAVGGLVDMRAARIGSNEPLQLRSDQPTVLEVMDDGNNLYTLSGQSQGSVTLTAFDSGGDVDHLMVPVAEISQIDYSTVSTGYGTFSLTPNGSVDGTFVLNSGVQNFTLVFLQVDGMSNQMLGRDTFTEQLDPGLTFQAGKSMPDAMEFDLVAPSKPGNYDLVVRAKYGPGRFEMQITVN